MLKKLFSHSVIYALGPQIPKVAGIFILPLITRYLTPEDYGIIGVVTAYTGLLSGLQDLGIAVPMVNIFFRYPSRWKILWRQLHGIVSVWSVVFAFLQAALLYFVIPEEAYDNRLAIILLNVIPIALFNTTINFCSRYYQYAQKPIYISFVSALVGVVTMVLNIVTIVHFELGYLGWMLSSALGTLISFLFYAFPLYYKHMITPILRFNRNYIFSQLKVALPTIPHNYSAYLLNSSDRMVMDILGIDMNKLGRYNLAYTFGNYFEFGGNAVGMAVGPITTTLMAEGKRSAEEKLRNLIFFLQIGFIAASFLVCLWCKELFQLLIKNDELQQAYGIAIIIIMGYNYRPMYWAVVNRLGFFEKTQHLWKISFVAGMLNLVLNFIFIPVFGYVAAAYTTFVSLLVIGFSGFLLSSYKETTEADIKYQPLLWMLLIIASTGVVLVLKDVEVTYKAALTVIALAITLVAAKKYAPLD